MIRTAGVKIDVAVECENVFEALVLWKIGTREFGVWNEEHTGYITNGFNRKETRIDCMDRS